MSTAGRAALPTFAQHAGARGRRSRSSRSVTGSHPAATGSRSGCAGGHDVCAPGRIVVVANATKHADANPHFVRTEVGSAPRTRRRSRTSHIRGSLGVVQATNEANKSDHGAACVSSPSETVVPVFVKLPVDTVSIINTLNYTKALHAGMRALKQVGVQGVTVDCWWGIVEAYGPGEYDWSAYRALVNSVAESGLKLQVDLGFHAHNCNTGSECTVSLPPWVLEVAEENPDVFYADASGERSNEYLSLAVDDECVFRGRSAVRMYEDFMRAFRREFADHLGRTIVAVGVSLGPEGELRYPAFRDRRWSFPGVGAFQCYDGYMLRALRRHAEAVGRAEWGHGGPHDAGGYNDRPERNAFFAEDHGSWRSEYGAFFADWYAKELVDHCDRVLGAAARVFDVSRAADNGGGGAVRLEAKLPACHWWAGVASRPAEMVAGYNCAGGRDGYKAAMRVLARHGARAGVAGAEMSDAEQASANAACAPEGLLLQLRQSAAREGVEVAVENALPRYDDTALQRVARVVAGGAGRRPEAAPPPVAMFTFLRMGAGLFQPAHWRAFCRFMDAMCGNAAAAAAAPSVDGGGGEAQSVAAAQPRESVANARVEVAAGDTVRATKAR